MGTTPVFNQPLWAKPAPVFETGCPFSPKGVFTAKRPVRLKSPKEWFEATDTDVVRKMIEEIRNGNDKVKTSLPAMVPLSEVPVGYDRNDGNSRWRVFKGRDGSDQDQNGVTLDFDHIPDDKLQQYIDRVMDLYKEEQLDILLFGKSPSGDGLHLITTTLGFEQYDDIVEIQKLVCELIGDGIDQYLDPHVHTKSGLLFCGLKHETYILSKRLFV